MPYPYPNATVQIFCKAPIAGNVKTRLFPVLSPEKAAELHIELTENLLKLLSNAALCPIQLWCSPSIEHPFFQKMQQKYNLTLYTQTQQQLGARMHSALTEGLKEFQQVILIGCDCASLTIEDFCCALEALEQGKELVLSPTEDGGYILIGVNKAQAEVLSDIEMPWGTSDVLKITRQRVLKHKIKYQELREQWDIDEPKDLERYLKVKKSYWSS